MLIQNDPLGHQLAALGQEPLMLSASMVPVFVESPVSPRNVRAEFFITADRAVKVHLWPNPDFPANFGESLRRAYDPAHVSYAARFDYVPEVRSWFLELSGFSLQLTPELVHSLLGRLRDQVG